MQYPDGQAVMLGHVLLVEGGARAVIAGLIGDDAIANGHQAADWSYLETGALVQVDDAGLTHYEAPHPDWVLLSRA